MNIKDFKKVFLFLANNRFHEDIAAEIYNEDNTVFAYSIGDYILNKWYTLQNKYGSENAIGPFIFSLDDISLEKLIEYIIKNYEG